jgi:hypothetical protein
MAMKWKSFDLNTKLEIRDLYGVSRSSKSEIGILDRLISLTLFMVLKKRNTKTKLNSVVFSPQANYTDRATAACWQS